MAAVANLRIDQGASFSSDVTVTNSDGNAVDLTGYTTEAKMAKQHGASVTTTITSSPVLNLVGVIIFREPPVLTIKFSCVCHL